MSTNPQRSDAAIQPEAKAGLKRPASEASLEIAPDGKSKRFKGCSKISNYTLMSKLGEGTFGEVYKAESRSTGEIVAMKKILMHQEKDGFPVTALREIKLLKMLSHPNVLKLEEMAMERSRGEGRKKATVYMVTPYMDHDLSGLLENPAVHFSEAHLKCYMIQLLEGVAYLHKSKILHRDMKAANLLINNEGILQIADFGLARPYDDPPPRPGHGNGEATRSYTSVVVTRWYRPPELLLGLRYYTPAIDLWGVGCVFAEMFEKKPILAGHTDLNQLQRIFELVGSPTELNMPGWTQLPGCEGVKTFAERQSTLSTQFRSQGPLFISLLSELMKLDWRKRVNAMDALEHPYFKTEPLPSRPSEIPQFQESHELDRRKFREQRQNPPPAPAGGTVGMGPDADLTNGSAQNGASGQEQSHPNRNQYRDRQSNSARRPGWEHPSHRGGPESRPPPPQSSAPPPSRRPAWERGHAPNTLPPRPPVDIPKAGPGYQGGRSFDGARMDGSSERPPHDHNKPRFRSGGPPPVDTYIPTYGPREAGRRSRDDEYRRREEPPRRDDRERTSDRREGRDERDQGRRRSRSPQYRDRDRDRDRNRELYRR